jgi:HEAT repeat protein
MKIFAPRRTGPITWASWASCAAWAGLAATAAADVVHVTDGRRLVGAVARDPAQDALVITTLDGEITVARSEVQHHETAAAIERRLEELQGGDTQPRAGDPRLRAVALIAAQNGLFERALDAADRWLAGAPAAELPAELYELPIGESRRGRPLSPEAVTALLATQADRKRPARTELGRARLLAAASGGIDTASLAALVRGVEAKEAAVRVAALEAIGAARAGGAHTAIARAMLRDPDSQVRRAALEAARACRDQQVLEIVLTAARKGDSKLRLAALETLDGLADPRAVGSLIRMLEAGGGYRGVRSSLSVTRQVAYVKDFDVEIATAAVIADPVVDVVSEGAVLDVTVLGVHERQLAATERRQVVQLLEKLTSRKLGGDPRAWRAWLDAQAR